MQVVSNSIGVVEAKAGFSIRIESKWRSGLHGLDGFSHVVVLWHANLAPWNDRAIRVSAPYKHGPEEPGIFATRSPMRPGALCVSVAPLIGIDSESGSIELAWIDAQDGTPVIDIKPYHPSSDRVETPRVPSWCASWPGSLERSGRFDWSKVFNFS